MFYSFSFKTIKFNKRLKTLHGAQNIFRYIIKNLITTSIRSRKYIAENDLSSYLEDNII